LKWVRRCLGLALLLGCGLLGTMLFADELVRLTTRKVVEPPIALPAGVEIREAPRLVKIIGAPVGGAAAVTVGHTILVPPIAIRRGAGHGPRFARDTLFVSSAGWRRIILHERDHALQRDRYGRWYLPLYVWWFARYGYERHPLERGKA
jgi:hypothetical protein